MDSDFWETTGYKLVLTFLITDSSVIRVCVLEEPEVLQALRQTVQDFHWKRFFYCVDRNRRWNPQNIKPETRQVEIMDLFKQSRWKRNKMESKQTAVD